MGNSKSLEVEVNGNNFKQEVLESSIPVLVDFWASWCMPCRMLAPTIEKLAEEWLYRWRKSGEEVHLIIVDPPRKGCSLKVLKGIIKIKPKKIIYVSCNPATLARDLKYLTKDDDYKLKKVLPIDMFPQTSHVECIASLER